MTSTNDLADEAAQVLLGQIKRTASHTDVASRLLELAQAYSTVVESMPKPTSPLRVSKSAESPQDC